MERRKFLMSGVAGVSTLAIAGCSESSDSSDSTEEDGGDSTPSGTTQNNDGDDTSGENGENKEDSSGDDGPLLTDDFDYDSSQLSQHGWSTVAEDLEIADSKLRATNGGQSWLIQEVPNASSWTFSGVRNSEEFYGLNMMLLTSEDVSDGFTGYRLGVREGQHDVPLDFGRKDGSDGEMLLEMDFEPGGQPHEYKIERKDSTFNIYADGEKQGAVTDETYTDVKFVALRLNRGSHRVDGVTVRRSPTESETKAGEETETTQPDPVDISFQDGWENGNITDPRWLTYGDGYSFVDEEGPDNGNESLRLSSNVTKIRTQRTFRLDAPWKVEGAVKAPSFSQSSFSGFWTLANIRIGTVDEYGADVGVSLTKEKQTDSGSATLSVPDGERKPTQNIFWEAEKWYQFEITHDGEGGYSLSVWKSEDEKPDNPQVVVQGNPASGPENQKGIGIGSGGEMAIHYSHISFESNRDMNL